MGLRQGDASCISGGPDLTYALCGTSTYPSSLAVKTHCGLTAFFSALQANAGQVVMRKSALVRTRWLTDPLSLSEPICSCDAAVTCSPCEQY